MYLIDSNVLIAARNSHYGFDFCPGFWAWLDTALGRGVVGIVRQVRDEIVDFDDELAEWTRAIDGAAILPEDERLLEALREVAAWVRAADRYAESAKRDFLGVADYFLVGHGLAGSHTVVTHERPRDSVKRVKIPDACIAMGVEWIDPFTMLRRERVRLVLAGDRE